MNRKFIILLCCVLVLSIPSFACALPGIVGTQEQPTPSAATAPSADTGRLDPVETANQGTHSYSYTCLSLCSSWSCTSTQGEVTDLIWDIQADGATLTYSSGHQYALTRRGADTFHYEPADPNQSPSDYVLLPTGFEFRVFDENGTMCTQTFYTFED